MVQRVSRASVSVDGGQVGSIERGLLIFLGVAPADDNSLADTLAAKIVALRVFPDSEDRMNRSLADTGGAILCIPQFTLYGDIRRGNRPSFTAAAEPGLASALYARFCEAISNLGIRCEHGVFGAHMDVDLVNDGPVTLVIDTEDLARPRR